MGISPMQHFSFGGTGQNTDIDTSAEALVASAVPAKRVLIKALNGNAGLVYVGLTGVSTTTGYHIAADQETPWIAVPDDDLQNIFVIASQVDQGVSYIYDV